MSTAPTRLLLRKGLCHWGGNGRSATTFTKFSDYLLRRRQQADKSLLIELPNFEVVGEVKSYLQKSFGPLETLYHYSIPKKRGSVARQGVQIGSSQEGAGCHWLLAEFENGESVQKYLEKCRWVEGTLPFLSSMCWYESGAGSGRCQKGERRLSRVAREVDGDPEIEINSETLDTQGTSSLPDFSKGATLSEQIKELEESTKLSELGIRVRFFVASQLERTFRTLFPAGCVLPFGSTVSGIGRQSADLDLVLVPHSEEFFSAKESLSSGSDSRLYSQSKLFTALNTSNARFQSQRVMETLADVIQLFVPGCSHVQRILQARVPILRFSADCTDLQCDLSMTNSSGVHMSELIYLMTKLEPRFPTLLFTIRSWAAARRITNPVPGRQPTNFMFVLLLMYFLQRKHLLPTLDVLFNNAGKADHRVTADGIDCSFLREPAQILNYFTPSTDNESLAELLYSFFEFYSDFDFNSKGVSLVAGSSWGKPDSGPLYIQNPLERHLNVARNVSKEEVTRLRNECCSALWKLETSWNALHCPGTVKEKSDEKDVPTLRELLLIPSLSSSSNHGSASKDRLQVKELFTK